MNDITIYVAFKALGMNLARYHKIDLVGCNAECFKVDSMCAATFGK